MNRSVILTVILVVAFVGFITAFAAPERSVAQLPRLRLPPVDYNNVNEEGVSRQVPGLGVLRTEPNAFADPNKIRAKLKSYAGLDKGLQDLDRQSQTEMREWLQKTTDNRAMLARAMERQVRAELEFIRKIAVEEKATKTVAAIDGLALTRQERTIKLVRKMDEEAKALRQPRGGGLRTRSRYPDQQQVPVGGVGGTETYPPEGAQPGTGQEQYREEDQLRNRLRRR